MQPHSCEFLCTQTLGEFGIWGSFCPLQPLPVGQPTLWEPALFVMNRLFSTEFGPHNANTLQLNTLVFWYSRLCLIERRLLVQLPRRSGSFVCDGFFRLPFTDQIQASNTKYRLTGDPYLV